MKTLWRFFYRPTKEVLIIRPFLPFIIPMACGTSPGMASYCRRSYKQVSLEKKCGLYRQSKGIPPVCSDGQNISRRGSPQPPNRRAHNYPDAIKVRQMNGNRRIRLLHPGIAQPITPPRENFISEIKEPELHIFPAAEVKNTGIATLICPGGGYAGLAIGSEGHACAAWLSSIGVTGIVLQYRLPYGKKSVPLGDAHLGMRYVRENAGELGVNPGKVGIIGFSAGGHLAALVSNTHNGAPEKTRPDFSVLFYPVISMEESPKGLTAVNLLGRKPAAQDAAGFSGNRLVSPNTPPALLFHCDDDPLVPPRHSILYYEALRRESISASLHIFPEGGHAWGLTGANMDGTFFRYEAVVRELAGDWIKRVTP